MSTRMIHLGLLLTALAPAAVAGPAVCRATTSGIAFGRVEALHQKTSDSVGEVTLACEGGEPATVSVALLDAQAPDRESDGVVVRLYLDAGMRVRWGDGHAGTAVIQQHISGVGRAVHIPVYARLDLTSAAVAGSQVRNLTLAVTTHPRGEAGVDNVREVP